MPLPHFLILVFTTIFAAGLTIWVASAVGVPIMVLGVVALMAAAIARLVLNSQ